MASSTPDKHRPLVTRPQSYAVPGQVALTVVFAFIVIAALYFARDLLMPFALAVLLSFVLAPLVRRLQRWYVPRGLAVMSVTLLAFAVIFALGGVIVSQVNDLAKDLPRYQTTLREKIQSLRGMAGGSRTLERASEVLQNLSEELNRPSLQQQSTPAQGQPQRPIPVEVRQPDEGPVGTLLSLLRTLIQPLATTGLVVIFVIFILWHRQDLRNRLVRLAGSNDLNRTTRALNDAGKRLSRLFLTQLALNASFGLVIGLAWWVIGVPSAALWGILALVLRFLPYIGTWIAAVFPLLIAAAVGSGWSMFLWAAAVFIIVDIVVGQVIEPMLQGQSTGLSPVAVIASATFWTWLWGPIGLLLATPITMTLAVLGRHVDSLKFLDVMFGDRPALTPHELAYQRMLARDPIEVTEEARAYLKERPLANYYEDILLGGLRLAQIDSERVRLDDEGSGNIRDSIEEIIDDLQDHIASPALPSRVSANGEKPLAKISEVENRLDEEVDDVPESWRADGTVLCLPGNGTLDHALALIIANLLGRRGFGVRAEEASALSMSQIFSLDTKDTRLICVCYMEDGVTPAQIRYALRRLRRKAPGACVVISLMGDTESLEGREVLIATHHGVRLVEGSLQETVNVIAGIASQENDPPTEAVEHRRSASSG